MCAALGMCEAQLAWLIFALDLSVCAVSSSGHVAMLTRCSEYRLWFAGSFLTALQHMFQM